MSVDKTLAGRMSQTYGTVVENQCQSCLRRSKGGALTCEAFPQAIPMVIFMGLYDHTHPYDMDGEDDGGLTYVPIDEQAVSFADILAKNS